MPLHFPSLARNELARIETQGVGPAGGFAGRYWSKPGDFLRDCITFRPDEVPAAYQIESLEELHRSRRLALRSCHGAGKTAVAAWAVIHFASTREAGGVDWKVVTTASVWRQLSMYLWPEVHKWAHRLKRIPGLRTWGDDELQTLLVRLTHGQAFAVASNDEDKIEGAHAAELLYVLDEAKAIPDSTWDAVEGAFSSGTCYALAISTPGPPQGRFYDIHRRQSGYLEWSVRHVKLEEAIAAGRVSQEWADRRLEQWGDDSPIYRARVLGEFSESEANLVIPLSWVEDAIDRWHEVEESGLWLDANQIGVDIGWMGSDESVAAVRCGTAIRELVVWSHKDTMESVGRVIELLRKYPRAFAVVDVVGVGAGVYDRLIEQGFPVVPYNAGAGAGMDLDPDTDPMVARRFANLRAKSWWFLRELLDPNSVIPVALPEDPSLVRDLTAPTWGPNSKGETVVEPKDRIRPRLGRSTDRGDAVVMAFYQPPTPADRTYLIDSDVVEISPL